MKKYTDPTPRELLDIELLKRALPPVHVNPEALPAFAGMACVDLEWNPDTGELELIGVGNETLCVQLTGATLSERRTNRWVTELLASNHVVIQNADGDIRKLRANGWDLAAASFRKLDDPMQAHSVLHSEDEHTLEYLSLIHGVLPPHKHLQWVRGAESVYNAADLVQTCAVWRAIDKELTADPRARFIYESWNMPFIWVGIEGEEKGIRVAPGVPEKLWEKYDAKREQARLLFQAYCGWPANLNSPDQFKHVVYNLEGLPVQRERSAWGVEGKATTDKEALATLRRMQGTEWDDDDVPTLLQAWANILDGGHPALEAKNLFSNAQQVCSHYIEPCRDVVRIYPEVKQHVQTSGRHSYTGPAVQQFKGELLSLLTPDPGTCWCGFDWSQIEVRILAALARDWVYLNAFAQKIDIHELNVRAIFGPSGSVEIEVTRRGFAKRFVFRLHYRGKAENAGNIPGTRALNLDAERLVDASNKYLALHPALVPYWAQVEAEAERTNMVRTFQGRPRRLTGIYQAARNREACNHPMQGAVADIYVETALMIKAAAPWAWLVYGSHDAQWWQVPIPRRLEFEAILYPIVTRQFEINGLLISFPADFKIKEAVA